MEKSRVIPCQGSAPGSFFYILEYVLRFRKGLLPETEIKMQRSTEKRPQQSEKTQKTLQKGEESVSKREKSGAARIGGACQKPERRRWRVGDPLTREDRSMLEVVVRQAERLGYSPTQKDVSNAEALKRRFGNWSKVMLAAGLPRVDEREQSLKRQASRDWQTAMARHMGLFTGN